VNRGDSRALAGDSAGAIRAYRHYLALRHSAEAPLRAEVGRAREALAQLERKTAAGR
jgi:hypothetical protein